MARPYYTLCVWDTEQLCWFDDFGSYSKQEVKEEIEFAHYNVKAKHRVIVQSDGTVNGLLIAIKALPVPK